MSIALARYPKTLRGGGKSNCDTCGRISRAKRCEDCRRKRPDKVCARPGCDNYVKRWHRQFCSRTCSAWATRENRVRQMHRRQEFTEETGPPITKPLSPKPECLECGGPAYPDTDFLGRTILGCPQCGSRLVRTIGKHRYDQRERHEVEIEQLITRGRRRLREVS